MSKDLLRTIGEFFYGAEWVTPLGRDLAVNDRTMRRWVAGTEQIPSGVWKDIDTKLTIFSQALGTMSARVKRVRDLVEVHSFKVWDNRTGDMVQPERKSIADRIARVGGEIIPGSAAWISSAEVDPEGRVINPTRPSQKEERSARELADMITAKLDVAGARIRVDVHPDPVYGWHPTVLTIPDLAVQAQLAAERHAAELRAKYDLARKART
jgi:hypothetical protein